MGSWSGVCIYRSRPPSLVLLRLLGSSLVFLVASSSSLLIKSFCGARISGSAYSSLWKYCNGCFKVQNFNLWKGLMDFSQAGGQSSAHRAPPDQWQYSSLGRLHPLWRSKSMEFISNSAPKPSLRRQLLINSIDLGRGEELLKSPGKYIHFGRQPRKKRWPKKSKNI